MFIPNDYISTSVDYSMENSLIALTINNSRLNISQVNVYDPSYWKYTLYLQRTYHNNEIRKVVTKWRIYCWS